MHCTISSLPENTSLHHLINSPVHSPFTHNLQGFTRHSPQFHSQSPRLHVSFTTVSLTITTASLAIAGPCFLSRFTHHSLTIHSQISLLFRVAISQITIVTSRLLRVASLHKAHSTSSLDPLHFADRNREIECHCFALPHSTKLILLCRSTALHSATSPFHALHFTSPLRGGIGGGFLAPPPKTSDITVVIPRPSLKLTLAVITPAGTVVPFLFKVDKIIKAFFVTLVPQPGA